MWHPPAFWSQSAESPSLQARMLEPLAAITTRAASRRVRNARPGRGPIPVVSVGNIALGGQGKTPLVLALAAYCRNQGAEPHLITRGYGGRELGPYRVQPEADGFRRVGDEALLLANNAPTWVARNRLEGVRAAAEAGAGLAILDDAHQHFSLVKDVSLVAVDAEFGFGNGRVLPAGPLREPVAAGFARADAVVLTGRGGFEPETELPVLRARSRMAATGLSVAGSRVIAFAGIGRPEKFFELLRNTGSKLIRAEAFPDHHPYRPLTLQRLIRDASAEGCVLVTTEKDAVRIPPAFRTSVVVQKVVLGFEDEAELARVLAPVLPG